MRPTGNESNKFGFNNVEGFIKFAIAHLEKHFPQEKTSSSSVKWLADSSNKLSYKKYSAIFEATESLKELQNKKQSQDPKQLTEAIDILNEARNTLDRHRELANKNAFPLAHFREGESEKEIDYLLTLTVQIYKEHLPKETIVQQGVELLRKKEFFDLNPTMINILKHYKKEIFEEIKQLEDDGERNELLLSALDKRSGTGKLFYASRNSFDSCDIHSGTLKMINKEVINLGLKPATEDELVLDTFQSESRLSF